MTSNYLKRFILECVRQTLNEESYYRDTATPEGFRRNEWSGQDGRGNHSGKLDKTTEHPQDDRNGRNFVAKHYVVSDNRLAFYKVKIFGNPNIKETRSLFGKNNAKAEVELRRAIDTVNGAADRNGKILRFRTITSESFKELSERTSYMSNTFWEFSFDGDEWYVLKPEPVQNLKVSTFKLS